MWKNIRVILVILGEIGAGLVISLASIRVFYEFSERIFRANMIYIDETMSWFVYSFRNPILTEVMKFVTFLGSGYWLGTIAVLTIGYLMYKKHTRPALLFGLSLLVCAGLNLTLKHFIDRPRPNLSPLVEEKTTSFPSGHAMNSFVFYFTLAYFSYRFTKNQYVLSKYLAIAISIVSLVGLSRVYLGVHYPSDVAAGFVAGFAWLLATMVIEKTLYFYRVFRVKIHP
ncbi:MAG: phosphatase PAP2 family protein [Candidatus Shapirobacteria bacterium]|jgi:undecaprenyl-diphosphatase